MAESRNTQLADALTTEHLRALRAETQHRHDLWALLGLLEGDLLQTMKMVDPTEPRVLAWRRRRVTQMMDAEITPLVRTRYRQMAAKTTVFLVGLAQASAAALRAMVYKVTGDDVLSEPVPLPTLRQRVTETLFPSGMTATDLSATGATWWTRLRESMLQRLGDQALVSVSLEESLPALVARMRGTAALGHTDGVIAKAKQDAARLVRTAVTHAVGTARAVVAEANPDSGMVLEHSSIIDNRTSLICLGRDGLRFTADESHAPIGHNIPYLLGVPYHPNCRSSMLIVARDGGPVAGGNIETFLRRQSTATQQAMLGRGRWQLWREGMLNVRDVLESLTGRPLTLDELRI